MHRNWNCDKKNLPTNKSPGPDGFTGEFRWHFKKEPASILLKFFQNFAKEGKHSNSFCEATITLIWKPGKDATNKIKIQANITDEHRCKNSQQNSSKQNPTACLKRSYIMTKWALSQGFFNICKLINVIHHINKLQDKNHMIISIDTEKACNKIQHPFMTQSVQKAGTKGTYLNIIKAMINPQQTLSWMAKNQKHFP